MPPPLDRPTLWRNHSSVLNFERSMRVRVVITSFAISILPSFAFAQAAPVAQAFRDVVATQAKNLVAAAEIMPADKYGFKPTPAQMSFGDIVVHLSGANDVLCGTISGMKASPRTKITAAASKEALVDRLKETFAFCHQALAGLDDSKLGEQVTMFGQKQTRAAAEAGAIGDWADHYSQVAIYLRLNDQLPPTAKKPGA
ncbi:MAG: DinB family protein [Gemmatimonadaceae bacterium]